LEIEANKKAARSSPPPSPDFLTMYSNASYLVDDVMLSERGMMCLKAQTLEKDKPRRRKKGNFSF